VVGQATTVVSFFACTDGIKLLVTLARSIDPNHIGNLVIENATASILGNEQPAPYPTTDAYSCIEDIMF
jgi:hypothetical protein